MKLVRNAVTEANPDLRGRKHHFTIENAAPAELEAMDQILELAGWENDTCPCYEDGWSCGYWIDLSEVDCFKAAYIAAKAGVKGFMAVEAERAAAPAEKAERVEVYAMYATVNDSIVAYDQVQQITAVVPTINGTVIKFGDHAELFEAGETILIVENTAPATITEAHAAQIAFYGANDYSARRAIVEACHAEAVVLNDAMDTPAGYVSAISVKPGQIIADQYGQYVTVINVGYMNGYADIHATAGTKPRFLRLGAEAPAYARLIRDV